MYISFLNDGEYAIPCMRVHLVNYAILSYPRLTAEVDSIPFSRSGWL